MAGCGILTCAPSEMVTSAVTDISAAGRSGVIGGGPFDNAAFRHSRHQPVTNQQRHADHDSEHRYPTSHGFLSRRTVELCIAKMPWHGHLSLPNVTTPFIEHSSGI
jgi:hypothetical protein